MNERLLIDTDVLIDYLRANSQSIDFLENLTQLLLISSITVAELYAGVREGKERTALNNFISVFEVVPIDEKIAILGGLYRRDYGKSHGVGLADALIAATANIKQAKLVTLNQKHFPMLTDLIIPYKKG
ncbi:MAG TPA: type II toxin-antitoxin system VapC family toxin [Candidatus Obscuribacterales bacterium]